MQSALIVDLDGCLAIHNGRSPYEEHLCEGDLLCEPVDDLITRYWDANFAILLVSGRSEAVRDASIRWLKAHRVSYTDLYLRLEGDTRRDTIVKEEIYHHKIEPFYSVLFCLDDRARCAKLWRSLGLTCFQVAEGDF